MIRLHLEGKSYGSKPVLGKLTFELMPGARAAILGPSGVGKSTLLRIIAGLDTDFEGTRTCPERLAMVFQEPTLLPWRTVADNLKLTTGADEGTVQEALRRVGLEGFDGQFPGQLSLGQQRRVSLARALAAKPEVLLLDEPFASLDAELADEMRALTEELISDTDMTVVLVTHAPEDASAIGAEIFRMGGAPAFFQ